MAVIRWLRRLSVALVAVFVTTVSVAAAPSFADPFPDWNQTAIPATASWDWFGGSATLEVKGQLTIGFMSNDSANPQVIKAATLDCDLALSGVDYAWAVGGKKCTVTTTGVGSSGSIGVHAVEEITFTAKVKIPIFGDVGKTVTKTYGAWFTYYPDGLGTLAHKD